MNKVVSEDALRRALLVVNLLARERPLDSKQMRLDLASPSVHECGKLWEYAGAGQIQPHLLAVQGPLAREQVGHQERSAQGVFAHDFVPVSYTHLTLPTTPYV